MKLDKADIKELQSACTIYWWNHGKKAVDTSGTLQEVLKAKDVVITKKPRPDHEGMFIYTCKISIGSQEVTIKQAGNAYNLVDLAFQALLYTMAYLGDKSQIFCRSRTKTFNF